LNFLEIEMVCITFSFSCSRYRKSHCGMWLSNVVLNSYKVRSQTVEILNLKADQSELVQENRHGALV